LHCRHSISGFLLGGRAAQPDGMVRRCAVAHHGSTSYRTVCDTTIQWMTRSMAGHPGVWTAGPPASISRRAGGSCRRARPISVEPAEPRPGPAPVVVAHAHHACHCHGTGRGGAEVRNAIDSCTVHTRTYSCKSAARMMDRSTSVPTAGAWTGPGAHGPRRGVLAKAT
jgi:hypothetical protein